MMTLVRFFFSTLCHETMTIHVIVLIGMNMDPMPRVWPGCAVPRPDAKVWRERTAGEPWNTHKLS